MASVDGARSLLGASDETYDFVCDPCKTENTEKEARHYCLECQEYLCDSCKLTHQKLKISKHHEVLSGTRMPKHALISQRPRCAVYCSCNQNREVEVYCEDHDEVICNPCQVLSHRKCKMTYLQDKAANYTSAKLDSVVKKTKSFKDKIIQLQQEREGNRSILNVLKDKCTKEIITFREELNNFLDKLEQNMLNELDKYIKEQDIIITEHISSLTMALERLDSEFEMLNQAKQSDRKATLFASEKKVSKSLKEYEVLIADMQKYVTKPVLSFERNMKLSDMQRDMDTLGCLKGKTEVHTRREGRVLLGLKIQSSSQIKVALLHGDKRTPWISGCCFMPNGYLALCDFENEKLKLLDCSFALQDNLKLSGQPYGVSVIDDNNVIITLPAKKQIQYMQVFPTIKADRVIQLDNMCYGIHVSGDELYTAVAEDRNGGVLVLDFNGNKKSWIGVNQDGLVLFDSPCFITVSGTDKIFVSDWRKNTVTCISAGGHITYQSKYSMLEGPMGIYVDAEDNVYVCGRDTDNVRVITADGSKCGTVVSASDGIKHPCVIAFRVTDGMLVVGCVNQDKLFCFKLA